MKTLLENLLHLRYVGTIKEAGKAVAQALVSEEAGKATAKAQLSSLPRIVAQWSTMPRHAPTHCALCNALMLREELCK